MLDLIAFSKDRPAQLDLLLRSMDRFVEDADRGTVGVVFTASEPAYDDGYALVRAMYPGVRWIDEREARGSFKELTLGLLGAHPYTAFIVDDNVFRAPFSFCGPELRRLADDPDVLCLSLRMAPWMDYCYPLDLRTSPPPFEDGLVWRWEGAAGDWGYPMSLDGHIFRTREIVPLLEGLDFRNPNTMEAALAEHPLAAPKAACLAESIVVNNPANRVQDVARNRSGNVSAAWLNAQFLDGRRLAVEPFVGLRNPGPHHETTYRWDGDDPRVSVVVPCFNYGRHLEEAVSSVLAQRYDDIEVVIVDDGSTDDTATVAAGLVARHPDRRIRVVSQENSGHPAAARNAGIAAAHGELVMCLDADDKLDEGYVGACVAALDRHPDAGLAYGDQQDFGCTDRRHVTPGWDFGELVCKNFITTSAMFRREAWEAAGGYDAGVGYEDWDLWIGIGEHGWGGAKADEALFLYRVHGDGRFAQDTAVDRATKARIVLKRPELYTGSQLAWARGVLAEDPGALAIADAVGVVPRFAEPSPSASQALDVRSFSTVALASEVFDDPDLLRAYAGAFGAADDATLVIYGSGEDTRALEARLLPLLASMGLDGPASPDMLAVGLVAAEGDALVARTANALLSGSERIGALGALARFDTISIAALRALAERAWTIATAPLSPTERFILDLDTYRQLPGAGPLRQEDLNPQLDDRTPTTPYDQHYFHQDVWAANRVAELRPTRHVDVGSRVDYAGQLTAICDVAFVDIRPLEVELDRFESIAGSVLDLPFDDASLESVSCLHVAEHIGLGRYGDPLDPLGSRKAAAELQRVLAPGGQLLFSGPVGRPRTCFNAHRVHDPRDVVSMFPELELVELSGVDDQGRFRRHRSLEELATAEYACGMFVFRRPADTARGTRRAAVATAPAPGSVLVDVGGFAMEVPPDMQWCFDGGRYYEVNVSAWLRKLCRSGVVYDIGANYGVHTLDVARSASAVCAFEPVSGTRAVLERNVARNGLENVRVFGVGLSDAPGRHDIVRYSSSGNNSLWERQLPPGHALRRVGVETVEIATLDAVVAAEGLPLPTLVKIDVEGAELAVLRGAGETLAAARPVVVLEYSETTSHDAGYRREDLVAELERLGYEVHGLAEDPSDLELHPREDWSTRAIANLLAVPAGATLPRGSGRDAAAAGVAPQRVLCQTSASRAPTAPAQLGAYPAVPPAPGDKREHLLTLFRERGHRLLVESGTYLGETVEFFLPHAREIISVEVEPKLFADAKEKFAKARNVSLVLGDSLHVIPEIVATLDEPPLLWLDGHFSEGVTGMGDELEPAASIVSRLGAIGVPSGTTLVIDDLRLFGSHPDFPGLDELVGRARAAFPHARVRIGLDSLVIEA